MTNCLIITRSGKMVLSNTMGHTDEFALARELCAKELGFNIGGEASEFRMAIDRAGQKRTAHCITLVKWWARPYHKGVDKYTRLMQLLRLVTPEKGRGTKYRNPQVGAAVAAQNALNDELADVLRREP